MQQLRWGVVWIATVLVLVLTGQEVPECAAQGVSVAPLRVLFDGRARSATVFLSNRTPETATYRIALVNRRMLESGAIVVADTAEPDELFADDLIRFSPRRVTIEPYGSQTIRLLVRRPRGDVPESAEYRTHLSVRSIPPTPRLKDLQQQDLDLADDKLSVKAVATVETIIPILIRLGEPTATVSINRPELVLDDAEVAYPQLTVELARTGERSIYGAMEVIHVAPGGEQTQLYLARGLAVYYPTSRRIKKIPLKTATEAMLQSGQLLVRYVESEDMNGDQRAQITMDLEPRTAKVQ